MPIRTLADHGGPGIPEDQVRAYAKQFTVTDKETGEDREGLPTDNFPANTGAGAPDLSLMAKSRAGFHGPYGTGINQLFKGMGGPEYIVSILTGYTGEEKEEFGSTFYGNKAFPGGWIAMAPPLSDDQVTYADGHPATVHHMSEDVASFLMWAAEPNMMARKQAGFVSVIFLIVLSTLLYLTNKRLWGRDQGQEARLIKGFEYPKNPAPSAGFFIWGQGNPAGLAAGRARGSRFRPVGGPAHRRQRTYRRAGPGHPRVMGDHQDQRAGLIGDRAYQI